MDNMDINMEDVKMPEAHQVPQSPLEPTTIPVLDTWIGGLLDCKQLSEKDVQRLCEKVPLTDRPSSTVPLTPSRLERSYKKSQMYSQWYVVSRLFELPSP